MKKCFAPLALCLTLSPLSLPARAELSLQALKAVTLIASWETALQAPLPAPAAPAWKPVLPERARPSAVLAYERRGYTWESDARNAMSEAERNLRAEGLAVL